MKTQRYMTVVTVDIAPDFAAALETGLKERP
jgi:hypothetical protein